jgi:hypothetical protein
VVEATAPKGAAQDIQRFESEAAAKAWIAERERAARVAHAQEDAGAKQFGYLWREK